MTDTIPLDLFDIKMSRNKFIKFLHDKSERDYADLRKLLKDNNWNMSAVYVSVFLLTKGNKE